MPETFNFPATAILLASNSHGLQPVYRVPAVRRLVLLLHRAGIRRVHLVGLVHRFMPVLSDLLPPESFHPIEDIASLKTLPGGSLFEGSDRFLALRADLVLDALSLGSMMTEAKTKPMLFMPVKGGAAEEGIYLAGKPVVIPILETMWSPDARSSDLPGDFHVIDGHAGLPYPAGEGPKGTYPSEDRLLQALAARTAADDGFMARHVDRPISRFISKRLARTPMKPNHITLVGMTIGLAGALFLSRPGYWAQLFGALLFLFCVIVDGVDGEVARLKLMESDFGHSLDVITDNIVHIAVFIGIAVGLFHRTGNDFYLHALAVLMVGFGLCVLAVYYCILKPGTGTECRSSGAVRIMALLSNRDFAYLVMFAAAVDRIDWFFTATVGGTYLFALLLWVFRLLESRPVEDEAYKQTR